MTDDPTKCPLCGYPRRVCQCVPSPPVKPVSGWQCPVCKRVHAPFVPQCSFCKPRRNYEVLDPCIPRESTTLRHGMTVRLPGDTEGTSAAVTLQTTNYPLRCYRCGNVIVGDVGYKEGTPHCKKCAPEAGPIHRVGVPDAD